MTFDPSNDYQIFDGIETVTLTARSRPGGVGATQEASPVTVAGAFREELTARDLTVGEGFLQGSNGVAWNLPGPTLGDAEPKRLDLITDGAGKVWIVQNVTYNTLVDFYRCLCNGDPEDA